MVRMISLLTFFITAQSLAQAGDSSGYFSERGPGHLAHLLKNTVFFIGALSLVAAFFLALVAKVFHKKGDPRVEEVIEVLPHAECGACGFAGCESYAEAVISDPSVAPNLCVPGGARVSGEIAGITNKTPITRNQNIARVLCGGGRNIALEKGRYQGVRDCVAAVLAAGGDKACGVGCLGYATCVRACPFGAISMGDGDLPVIDSNKCVGCGKCKEICPKKVFDVLPLNASAYVACHATGKGGPKRGICRAACIGCGMCLKVCPVKAPCVENGLSVINGSVCTACGRCVEKCPTKAIIVPNTVNF